MSPSEGLQFSTSLLEGVAESALYGAHRAMHRSSTFSIEGRLDGLPLRVSHEAILPLHLLHRGQANYPSLRTSDEHRFIVRVLRARRAPGRSLSILLRPRVARARETPTRAACSISTRSSRGCT